MNERLTDEELAEVATWAFAYAPLANSPGNDITRAAEKVERLIHEVRAYRLARLSESDVDCLRRLRADLATAPWLDHATSTLDKLLARDGGK